ncbi:hypothetical protein C6P26_08200 [Weissella confusa]|uniref:lysylphosphatidylglycerol synthase transmembrane domain-containing protein n=1 Tax=Weissella confusa TaxID=1583 RepID=UPI0010813BB0|nr:lysylphosphatidylglycerol synthase transmembrane domain-containing protein [Weissella confusa]MBJ7635259.1 flippase-like domain-containing protein [Weissella confusa]TGE42452.1 hypothetical protein C6P26_08200 [Weissella confusa]
MTRRNGIVFTIMMLIGLGIFYWSFRKISWTQFASEVKNANWWWLIVAVGAMVVYLLLEAVVVKIFVDDAHEKLSWRDAIRIPLVEQLGNGITPFATGGQPMQMITLAQAGIDPGRAGSILLMKFVVYQGMIVVNFLMALTIGYHYIADKLHAWAILVLFGFVIHLAVIVGLLLVMYWPTLTRTMVLLVFKPIGWFRPALVEKWKDVVDEKIDNFHRESVRMSHDWPALVKAIVVTFFQMAVYYLIPYFILLGLGVSPINVVLVTALHVLIVMVISLFPIPGGTGGAEAGFAVLFSQFLPSASVLLFAMMIWRLITYYLGMFAGIVAFNLNAAKRRK